MQNSAVRWSKINKIIAQGRPSYDLLIMCYIETFPYILWWIFTVSYVRIVTSTVSVPIKCYYFNTFSQINVLVVLSYIVDLSCAMDKMLANSTRQRGLSHLNRTTRGRLGYRKQHSPGCPACSPGLKKASVKGEGHSPFLSRICSY